MALHVWQMTCPRCRRLIEKTTHPLYGWYCTWCKWPYDDENKTLNECSGHCDQDGVCDCGLDRWERYGNLVGIQHQKWSKWAKVALGLAIALLVGVGCTPTRYEGVYMDESGFNVLIACEMETTPNDREILFCSRDNRGVW